MTWFILIKTMSVTLITTHGELKLELACQQTPKACKHYVLREATMVANFIGFAIQGGDPTGTGKGGESIYEKHFEDEFDTNLKHDRRGIVSMANQVGSPNTNGSQFFITYARQPHLNGTYTVFGRVIDGLDTLERMEKEPVGKKHRPIRDIVIQDVIIHANPIANDEDI